MNLMFDEFFEILEESDFEETPVDLKTFVEGKDYMNLPPLSKDQYALVAHSTQVYKLETLVSLYGEDEGSRVYAETCNEVVAQLGKGSGKDYCSTISIARIVYLLLCLKDPSKYYGKSSGDAIDILNVAINSEQAQNVFFAGFKRILGKSPWFKGKYYPTARAVEFDKAITCYSGHSQKESWEGYNFLVVVLDEISGFAEETSSGGNKGQTAEDLFDMYRGSVVSRFPKFGKVIELSFPRYKNDFESDRSNK